MRHLLGFCYCVLDQAVREFIRLAEHVHGLFFVEAVPRPGVLCDRRVVRLFDLSADQPVGFTTLRLSLVFEYDFPANVSRALYPRLREIIRLEGFLFGVGEALLISRAGLDSASCDIFLIQRDSYKEPEGRNYCKQDKSGI